jgi:CubicO group peptidase (beta-lactamase class C family)
MVIKVIKVKKFDEVMKLLMQRSNAPGAQLAVAKGGHIKYFRAFGIANRDSGEAVTTKHIMRYNSFSKVITGTAILKLVQVRLQKNGRVLNYLQCSFPYP